MKRSTSPFSEAPAACGLTHVEGAEYLDCKLERLRKWSSGAIEPPEWAMDRMALLFTIVDGDFEADVAIPDGAELRRTTIAELRSRVSAEVRV